MSWRTHVITNTVVVSNDVAKKLLTCGAEVTTYWEDVDDVVKNDHLVFIEDTMEHMDFLWEKEIQEVLKNARVEGDICFGRLEGDRAPRFWGYRFDGKGSMVELIGHISFKEV